MSGAPEVSHGRGGAGNITPDNTQYTDAEIVRTADEGTGVSTGRGGMSHFFVSSIVLVSAMMRLLCGWAARARMGQPISGMATVEGWAGWAGSYRGAMALTPC